MDTVQRARFAELRRFVIEQDFKNLNPMQRRAVLATEGPLLLLAGAGSGKTTVLIHRIANILRYGRGSDTDEVPEQFGETELAALECAAEGSLPIDDSIRDLCRVDPPKPWQIIAITFTNKAAGELRSRLEARLGPEAGDVWAMTFHGACSRILRRDADRLGFTKNFTIYDQQDSLAVMKRVLRELDLDEKVYQPKAMLACSSRYKSALMNIDEYIAQEEKSGDIRRQRTAEVCGTYAARLRESDAMDFEDLLYYCVILLRDNPDVLEYYQNRFRYVLIDEYQDTNHLQYRMAAMLAGGRRNFCVVGDDDQSIYRFRGATIENILSFEQQYKDARSVKLEQNYRSTGNILDAANAVIANNTERKGKNLWTESGAGEPIYEYIAASEDDEADFVARTIRQSGESPKNFAVLYRTNAQSRSVELALKRRQIPYRIFGGTRFFDRTEVKDMLAYLYVVANPTDETRLLRIINTPARGIGAASVEKAQQLAREQGVPLFEVLRLAAEYPELGRTAAKMQQFTAMIAELQELLTSEDLDVFYDAVIEKSGYVAALQAKNNDEELSRIENVNELKTSIVKHQQDNPGADLYSFLDEVALYTDLDNYDENADCTVMMTMHAAKGLEFPTVFLVGAEENLFPGALAIGEESGMEEERRLCYVAITRARKRLYITCAKRRMLYGHTNYNQPSRFLEEIPEKLIEKTESPEIRREREKAERTVKSFAGAYTSGYGDTSYGGSTFGSRWSGNFDDLAPQRPARSDYGSRPAVRPAPRPASAAKPKTAAAPIPEFRVGDRVEHSSFGTGELLKLTAMGNDALVEIDFGEKGVKKLMLRLAAQHMKKIME